MKLLVHWDIQNSIDQLRLINSGKTTQLETSV